MQHFSHCLSGGMKTCLHVNLVSLFRLLLVTAAATVNYTRDDFPVGFVFGSGTSAYQVLLQHKRNMFQSAVLSVFWLILVTAAAAATTGNYTRDDFPDGFVFGSGTSAYQYEGAAFNYGRTPSIWDNFAHRKGNSNGDVACDGYHKFKDDIKLMAEMGIEAFRISISWSRLIPKGRGPVNPLGLQFYNAYINQLISHGIQPHVTLYHLDMPQVLEDEYGGWLDRTIVEDFTAYSETCFKEFGDRVKFWTTFNEANAVASGGYSAQNLPPGRCSPLLGQGCVGNSSLEPYIVGHNILLAHSATWRLYKEKYEATQKGQLGFNILAFGLQPNTNTEEDIAASQRAMDFHNRWFLDPLVFGKYPESMSERVKGRIPVISKDESEQIKGSFDFFGLNYYTRFHIKDNTHVYDPEKWTFNDDMGAIIVVSDRNAGDVVPIGYPILPSIYISFLEYMKDFYGNPPIYIQENGQSTRRSRNLDDISRVDYLDAYIGATLDAIRNGSNIKGYMTWTFLDCYELFGGYEATYGFYYVDLGDKNLKRYQKYSSRWFSDFLRSSSSTITPVAGKGKRASSDHLYNSH